MLALPACYPRSAYIQQLIKFIGMLGRITLLMILTSSSINLTKAQSAPATDNVIGLPPGAAYDGDALASVQINNGNLHIELPIVTIRGRGPAASYKFVYDSKGFQDKSCGAGCGDYLAEESTNAFTLEGPGADDRAADYSVYPIVGAFQKCGAAQLNGHYNTVNGGTLQEPNGTKHPLLGGYIYSSSGPSFGCPDSSTSVGTLYASDGSGWMVQHNGPNAGIYRKDGLQVGGFFCSPNNCETQTDTNGNQLTVVESSPHFTLTDTLGRQNLPTNGSYYDSSGTLRQFTYTTTSVSIDASAFCPGCTGAVKTSNLVHVITLPNSTSYTIEYVQNSFGQPSTITLPTGGKISFGWSGFDRQGPILQTRSFTDLNGNTSTWTYQVSSTNPPSIGKVTDPSNNDTVYQNVTNDQTPDVYYYQGSSTTGTLLKSVHTDYGTFSGNEHTDLPDNLPIRVTTTLYVPNSTQSSVSKTETDWEIVNNTTYPLQGAPFFWTWRNPQTIREYDFGSGAPGALLRTTAFTYLHDTGSATSLYLLRNVADRALVTTISDSTGQVAKTTLTYDGGTLTQTSSVPGHDYTGHSYQFTARGNVTQISKWLNTTGGSVNTIEVYNDIGNLLSSTDANNHTTTFSYVDSWADQSCLPSAQSQSYLTSVTNALGQHSNYSYYSCTGLLQSEKDQNDISNGRTGNSYAYDLLNRLTTASFTDNGKTTNCFTDVGGATCSQLPPPLQTVTAKSVLATGLAIRTTTIYDALGRTSQSQLNSDPDGVTYAQRTYDPLGRPFQVFNPTRCTTPTTNCGETTWGVTTSSYDALGRTTSVSDQGGAVTFSYSGNCTTMTDQAGKSRKSCIDGLGRLTQVFEDPAGLNYETDYTHDALNNLLTVKQKGGSTNSANWRTRTFIYDSLSRLTQATNPESGTVSYSYDAVGNLLHKTSPAPNQTGATMVTLSYCYDALNRITGKAYTSQTCSGGLLPTPLVSYFYDQTSYNGLTIANGIGHRTGMSDQAGAEAWSYEAMGRPVSDLRTTNAVSKTFTYSYNLDGSTSMLGYPTGPNNTIPAVLVYQPGGAGRALALTYSGTGFVGAAHYTPGGASCYLQDYWDGTWTAVGTFNSRLQPITYQVQQQFSGTNPAVCTAMTSTADILDLKYNFIDANSHNNGNVQSITNNIDWHRTQSFTYDSLNRIFTAATNATNQPAFQGDNSIAACWAESFTYDPWGNMLSLGLNSATQPNYVGCTQESGFNYTNSIAANNRLAVTGFSYDAAGNMTASPGFTYVYDAENHLTSTAGITYTYDGDGRRVMKSSGTIYWYGQDSDPLIETDLSNNLKFQYMFFNGQRVGRQNSSNNVQWYFADHLGSSRIAWSTSGADQSDFYPFGGERVITSGAANRYKFTGKERDTESGLDNFDARYLGSSLGRFMSPDPAGLLEQKPGYPQSWNLYTYAMNNPLVIIDPTGLDCVYANDAGNGVESIDHNSNSGECGSNGGTWAPGYVDENWAHFNISTGMFQVGSVDGVGSNATVDYTNFAAGAQTDANGNCQSGCGGYGFASANANWLQSQLVGNSMESGLDGYIQFLTGRETPLQGGLLIKLAAGPLDPSKDHWAGPGGMGPPGGRGDWAASVHDYNFSTNDIKVSSYFNPTLSPTTSRALIKSNNTLMRNAGGIQSVKMFLFFGPSNALQWYANSWK